MMEAALLGVPYEGPLHDFTRSGGAGGEEREVAPEVREHRELRWDQDRAYEESLAADRWAGGHTSSEKPGGRTSSGKPGGPVTSSRSSVVAPLRGAVPVSPLQACCLLNRDVFTGGVENGPGKGDAKAKSFARLLWLCISILTVESPTCTCLSSRCCVQQPHHGARPL
jgi:hypothetical protein